MSKARILHQFSDDAVRQSRLAGFVEAVNVRCGMDFSAKDVQAYKKLHLWSVENPEDFYDVMWDFCGVVGDKTGVALKNPNTILDAEFYPEAKISFAENMLKRVQTHPHDPAIIERVAGRQQDRILSWQDVYEAVSVWEQILERLNVGEGDHVATYLPHIAEAYILMIAVSQRGAVFSSVGTEMGAQAAAARFEQIQPKVLIAVDGYKHMAKIGQNAKIEDKIEVVRQLQGSVSSLEKTIILSNLDDVPDLSDLDKNTVLANDLLADITPQDIDFKRRDFNTPLAILFSSGSTGQPKCFVHSTGGVLLKHAIEHQLQSDVRAGDKVFFHTTTSWMMFNWLASGLANEATIMIYDGNPAYPDAGAQLQFAADYGCTHLGTAAAIIQDVWARNDVRGADYDLSHLRSLLYTGSVLSDEGFVYAHRQIKQDMSIDGICGGTDFVGCYAMGNCFTPTIEGALKGPVLGMAIDVWDENGHMQAIDEVGELVVTRPFSSRPLYFLNDENKARFRAEYFECFDCDPPVLATWGCCEKNIRGAAGY